MAGQDTAIQIPHKNKRINWVRFETRRTSSMVMSGDIDTFLARSLVEDQILTCLTVLSQVNTASSQSCCFSLS
ncbi:MAG: hypothetical protein ACI9FR_000703 [Cryomorphaceae bacterium]|jgi:hypothetical protein